MLCFYAVLLLNYLLKVISSHILKRVRRNISDQSLICIEGRASARSRPKHMRLHAVLDTEKHIILLHPSLPPQHHHPPEPAPPDHQIPFRRFWYESYIFVR
jgi:hypothetical protein